MLTLFKEISSSLGDDLGIFFLIKGCMSYLTSPELILLFITAFDCDSIIPIDVFPIFFVSLRNLENPSIRLGVISDINISPLVNSVKYLQFLSINMA